MVEDHKALTLANKLVNASQKSEITFLRQILLELETKVASERVKTDAINHRISKLGRRGCLRRWSLPILLVLVAAVVWCFEMGHFSAVEENNIARVELELTDIDVTEYLNETLSGLTESQL